jgi:hypothetical protein
MGLKISPHNPVCKRTCRQSIHGATIEQGNYRIEEKNKAKTTLNVHKMFLHMSLEALMKLTIFFLKFIGNAFDLF